MTSTRWSALSRTQKILDLLLLVTAFALSFTWSAEQVGKLSEQGRHLLTLSNLGWLALLVSGWYICLSSLWIYRSRRLSRWHDEMLDVIKAVAYSTVCLTTVSVLAQWKLIDRSTLAGFGLMGFELLFVVRLLRRIVLRHLRRRGLNKRRVMIAGAGPRGQHMAELFDKYPELGYKFVGFVDNVEAPGILGPIDKAAEILASQVVDELIITLPVKSFYDEITDIIRIAEDQGVMVRIHSDLFNKRLSRALAEQFDETPVLTLYTGPRNNWMMAVKRLMDVVGSSVLLVLLSPLLLLIVLAVKMTSPGPALFIQDRIGFNKRRFRMYKFRTMVADAEQRIAELEHLNEAQGPVFKMKKDPRITSIGSFLRKTSLDELPQLFNVLEGSLSLVGPRPLSVRDFERFDEFWFNRRFSVRPGITCIWQVSGRSNTTFEQWIQQDLDYIDNWSLSLDFKILLKTIPAVIRGDGAM